MEIQSDSDKGIEEEENKLAASMPRHFPEEMTEAKSIKQRNQD